jgi:hypothetical protein
MNGQLEHVRLKLEEARTHLRQSATLPVGLSEGRDVALELLIDALAALTHEVEHLWKTVQEPHHPPLQDLSFK